MPTRVLIIDDHPLMREALSLALLMPAGEFDVETAPTLQAGTARMREQAFDVVMLDLGLPGCTGIDALHAARKVESDAAIAVVSSTNDPRTIVACLRDGADGFIPKTASREVMIHALRLIVDGGTFVPPEAIGSLGALAAEPAGAPAVRRSDAPGAVDPRQLGLTERQIDVLRLILKGLPNKLICRQLQLAEGTVKVHVSAVLRALGVRSRTQAVVAAGRMGLRPDEWQAA